MKLSEGRKIIRAMGAFLAMAVVMTMALKGNAGEANSIVTAEESVSRIFPAGISQIVLGTFNGDVEITVSSGKSVKADLVKRGSGYSQAEANEDVKQLEVTFKQQGSNLEIIGRRTDKRTDRPNSGVSAKLQIPAGTVLNLNTSNGKISCTGPMGNITATTSNEDITIRGAAGKLQLTTSNGPIVVAGGSGSLLLEDSNGSIDITSDGVVVSATTSNEPIHYSGKLAPGHHVFTTGNGEIELTLPAQSQFALDAETSNSEITSDFPVTATEQSDDVLRGTVGSKPSIWLKLHTGNADIKLHESR